MSLIVFPFKEEDLDVVGANLEIAAAHRRVDAVWAVAATQGEAMAAVEGIAAGVGGAPVLVFPQERIGRFRPGKGDGLNTALRHAAEQGFERIHFYDADITNFDEGWIDGAEQMADDGYQIVRHRFPRASTDAMITWMLTRPSLAILFPGTLLPRLGQPLGGEILLSQQAVAALAADPLVAERSDWGVDTLITYATATMGLPLYEHNVAEGKRHALYGSLAEIRTMVVECLDAVRSLRGLPAPKIELATDPLAPVPDDLKQTMGYDLERTVGLLTANWSREEERLAEELPIRVVDGVLANRSEARYGFMDADRWGDVLVHLHDRFVLGDPAWESLAFRLWLIRVLSYTSEVAVEGYDQAIEYLEATIRKYQTIADQDGKP